MAKQVSVSSVPQVCIVVDDIEQVAADYWNILGIGPWDILTLEEPILYGQKYKDADSNFGFRVGFAQVGEVQLELIESTAGPNMYSDFRDEQGEGLQHVMFLAETEEEAQKQLAAFAAHGCPVLLEGRFGDGYFVYVDSQPVLNCVWEIVKMPSALEAPAISIPSDKESASPASFKVDSITQIGLVAEDVDEAMRKYINVMGVTPWSVLDLGPSEFSNLQYQGKPTNVSERVGYHTIGNVQFQIVQPLSGANFYSDFMAEHGEGIDHLQFTVDDLEATIKQMNALGFETLMSGGFMDGGFAYFDTRDKLKCVWKALQPPTSVPGMTEFTG